MEGYFFLRGIEERSDETTYWEIEHFIPFLNTLYCFQIFLFRLMIYTKLRVEYFGLFEQNKNGTKSPLAE